MAHLPPDLLSNEDPIGKLAIFSQPIIRVVDFFAGATNAMRCDVKTDKDPTITASLVYGHENLESCVGECVTAFCCAILSRVVKPGVWFAEEAIQACGGGAAVLGLASVGAHTEEYQGTIDLAAADELWVTSSSSNLGKD